MKTPSRANAPPSRKPRTVIVLLFISGPHRWVVSAIEIGDEPAPALPTGL